MTPEPTRVLLVEDAPEHARFIQTVLDAEGPGAFSVDWADRLSAGLARLGQRVYDVVLLDLGLPDSQGLESFRTVARAAGDAAVVVLTANQDQRLGLTTVEEGAQDYLEKGVDDRALLRSIRYAVARKRSIDNLRALSARLQSAESDERGSIAREIDDELGQILTALKVDLAWIARRVSEPEGDPEAREFVLDRLVDMTRLVDATLISVRRIVAQLSAEPRSGTA